MGFFIEERRPRTATAVGTRTEGLPRRVRKKVKRAAGKHCTPPPYCKKTLSPGVAEQEPKENAVQRMNSSGHCIEGASLAGADWSKGFESLGDFFPQMPVQDGIANCPDFWRLPSADLLYFGDNHFWLGNYTKTKAPSGSEDQHSIRNSSIFFKANAPAQHFAPGTAATKGYWDEDSKRFVWWGWVQARSVRSRH